MKLRVALAQVNPTVGDLVGNAALIKEGVTTAVGQGAQIAIFPEMVLTGYPVEDLALRPSFNRLAVRRWQNLLPRLIPTSLPSLDTSIKL